MSTVWKPSVTVAAIIERDGRFLLIEEETSDGIKLNQPAGHLDQHESLMDAVIRETLEETAHPYQPEGLVGVYLSRYLSARTNTEVTYLRFTFHGTVGEPLEQPLDDGILRTMWMTLDELQATRSRHRSPLVLQSVCDYLNGQRAPLTLLATHSSALED